MVATCPVGRRRFGSRPVQGSVGHHDRCRRLHLRRRPPESPHPEIRRRRRVHIRARQSRLRRTTSSITRQTSPSTRMVISTCATGPTHRVQAYTSDGEYITTFIGDAQELSKWQLEYVRSNPDVYKARRRVYTLGAGVALRPAVSGRVRQSQLEADGGRHPTLAHPDLQQATRLRRPAVQYLRGVHPRWSSTSLIGKAKSTPVPCPTTWLVAQRVLRIASTRRPSPPHSQMYHEPRLISCPPNSSCAKK